MEKIAEVLVALRRVIRATDLRSKQLSKTAGLTAPQLLLMQQIRDGGELTVGELATRISLSQATVTNILDRLEKRGLIFRQRSEQDKRKVHAHLTDAGAEILAKAPTALQESFVSEFQALPDWEQSMILAALQRVARMMGAEDIDAAPVLDIGSLDRQSEETEA